MRYEIVSVPEMHFQGLKKVLDDGTEIWVPEDIGNSGYREYLEWKTIQETS